MEIFKDIIELLYYASGPIIAIFAFKGLKQLSISKQNAKIAAKRDSFRLAAEQCSKFLENIEPKLNELDNLLAKGTCDFITKSQVNILDNSFSVKFHKGGDSKEFELVISKVMEVLNCFEAFSLFFLLYQKFAS